MTKKAAMPIGAGAIAVAASAWYAVTPPSIQQRDIARQAEAESTPTSTEQALPSLDRGAFDVVLWHAPPPPPEPAPSQQPVAVARPTPPPDVDLLAIGMRGETREAVFYDKQSDRLLTLRVGESIGGYELRAITPVRVEFLYDTRTVSFDLDQPRIAERMGDPSKALNPEAGDD